MKSAPGKSGGQLITGHAKEIGPFVRHSRRCQTPLASSCRNEEALTGARSPAGQIEREYGGVCFSTNDRDDAAKGKRPFCKSVNSRLGGTRLRRQRRGCAPQRYARCRCKRDVRKTSIQLQVLTSDASVAQRTRDIMLSRIPARRVENRRPPRADAEARPDDEVRWRAVREVAQREWRVRDSV